MWYLGDTIVIFGSHLGHKGRSYLLNLLPTLDHRLEPV